MYIIVILSVEALFVLVPLYVLKLMYYALTLHGNFDLFLHVIKRDIGWVTIPVLF